MENMYERIKRMSEEEMRKFIYLVYLCGNEDGKSILVIVLVVVTLEDICLLLMSRKLCLMTVQMIFSRLGKKVLESSIKPKQMRKECINKLLDSILAEEFRYNTEWDFV